MIISIFAGRGGSCDGLKKATGRDPDVAINHNAVALAVHRVVHPNTVHLHGDVWHYAPLSVTKGRRVQALWASPTCTDFSQAKGAPLDRREATRTRALAWVVTRWAREVAPEVIFVENVPNFQNWGPLANDGRPDPKRRGYTFRRWVRSLVDCGYVVEWRELKACDYGSPTSRKRLFIVARRDGRPIVWPKPTHGPGTGQSYRSAAECIDWSIPVPSIFERERPLVEATCRRIARGVRKFVLETGEPFVISHYGTSTGRSVREPLSMVTAQSVHQGLVAPYLVHLSNGERPGQAPRIYDLEQPLGTVVAQGIKHGLTCAFLAKHFGGGPTKATGSRLTDPIGTVTARDHHSLVTVSTAGKRGEDVRRLMKRYEGLEDTVVTIGGERYEIVDIGMRQLVPAELGRAHDLENIEVDADGKPVTRTNQVKLIGNSVPREVAAALAAANLGTGEAIAA